MASAKQIAWRKKFAKLYGKKTHGANPRKVKSSKLPSGEKKGNLKNHYINKNGMLVGFKKDGSTYFPNREEDELWLKYVVKKGKMNVMRAGKIVSVSSSHLIKRHPELT